MARHDEVLTFVGEMADKFGAFRVAGIDSRDSSRTLSINEIIADDSDGEICFAGDANSGAKSLVLADFFANLRTQVERCPDYSLMVSEWFEIDSEHTGRLDMPLQGIEVDEESQTLQLIY